jgi:hypothetical protein
MTQFYKDIRILLAGESTYEDKPHYGYCNSCATIFGVLDFMEKYHNELRGEEIRKINGNNKEIINLYYTIRVKLKEFIMSIEKDNVICKCNEQNIYYDGTLYYNYTYMQELSEQKDYSKMANYTGYGDQREKYRLYHKNFTICIREENPFDPDDWSIIMGRDLQKVKAELEHWSKYFDKEHYSIITKTEKVLITHPKIFLNQDCISVIMDYL